jgi:hypothetical protein
MTQRPGLIDQTLAHGDLLFSTHGDRCRYIGLSARDQLLWLERNVGKWQRIQDVRKEAAPPAPPAERETKVAAAPAGPDGQTSPRDVQKDGDDKDGEALADTLPGDCLPPYQRTSLPTSVKANGPNGSTNVEPLRPVKVVTGEAVGSQTESTPFGAISRKRGRQLEKQKPPAAIPKAGPKLSPKRMRRVLNALRECPTLSHAADAAGIHRKALEYWIKCSKAGHDGYDVKWRGPKWRFHEHCKSAVEEAHQRLLDDMFQIAMGVIYKTDENGNVIEEVCGQPNKKMMLRYLEWMRPETWGKNRKNDIGQKGGVLVIGNTAKKPKCDTAASVKARKWKSLSIKVREAKAQLPRES